MKLIGITGGIGSGKSVVCKILEAMGYPVYDCDSRAKALMDGSLCIKEAIASRISSKAVNAFGDIDRQLLSEIVFSSPMHLKTLNSIVHAAVRDDIELWAQAQTAPAAFVESAILHTGGLSAMVDDIWLVTAPLETRIDRVICRNGITRAQVLDRIKSQEGVCRNRALRQAHMQRRPVGSPPPNPLPLSRQLALVIGGFAADYIRKKDTNHDLCPFVLLCG